MAVEELRRLSADVLGEIGVREEVAEAVAQHLVEAEATGHATHGVLQLPSLVRDIRAGVLDPNADPVIETRGAQMLVDARRAVSHWALPGIVDCAVEAARRDGACTAYIRNIGSTGRLGAYVARAARRGMAALFVTGSLGQPHEALVAAFGGRERLLGSNPIAFAAPTSGAPLVVDLSTAATTMGELRRSRLLGVPLESPAVIDSSGELSREPAAFYAGGAIVPAAGHKGYALALMAAALGALSGGHTADGRLAGSFLLVIRPASETYATELRVALDRVRSTDGVRVPGDRPGRTGHQEEQFKVAVPVVVLQEINRIREGRNR
ncbi:Ldh family oxidoreductase [Streptomyces sp. B21-105]|uniref:Ldh family oxidoreductase n=1 Tax=Streptomyces sp. B21-105 TaxID=3039417 RepID=UPI002FF33A77